jgi:hypothetical protein
LPKDRRPSEYLIWWGHPEEIETWLDKVISGKADSKTNIMIKDEEIEE